MKSIGLAVFSALVLAACGGGGGDSTCSGNPLVCTPANSSSATPAVALAQQCAAPRPAAAADPLTGRLYGDVQGSLDTEKAWIRAFIDDTYLWYDEVTAVNPAAYVVGATVPYVNPATNRSTPKQLNSNFDVVDSYFNALRSPQVSASGKPKDRFHFTVPTPEWTALSTSGSRVGFGFHVSLVAPSPPRKAVIAYADPGTVAAANGLNRGTEFISVNGSSVSTGDPAILNEALFTPVAGKAYTFEVRDVGSPGTRSVVISASTVASVPVQNVRTLATPDNRVGYIQYNDHIASAEGQLVAAINQLRGANGGAGITDLVLDIRYNGGGFLDLASELAYMVAGPARTANKTFETLQFNAKNPFGASQADRMTPFYSQTQGYSVASGQPLPHLDLPRVFVITGANTCSASESIMNGLRGAGVEVIQIGGATCGKPYGFLPQDNCGVTYFAVQFKGVNQLGFGDYPDGFIPGGTGASADNLPGCSVADDFSKPLGDVAEARISAALKYRSTGSCPGAAGTTAARAGGGAPVSVGEPLLGGRAPAQDNRFMRSTGAF